MITNVFTQNEMEVFEGTMLGDGSLTKLKNDKWNSGFIIRRALKDRALLEWEYSIFKKIDEGKGIVDAPRFDARTNKTYLSTSFSTNRHPFYTQQRIRWYNKEGRKIVPKDFILTPISLAKWIADDGHVSHNSPYKIGVKFATHGFLPKEVIFLVNQLNILVPKGIFRIATEKNGQQTINCNGDTAKAIFRMIDNVFPEGIERKRSIWRDKKYGVFQDLIKEKCFYCGSFDTLPGFGRERCPQTECYNCGRTSSKLTEKKIFPLFTNEFNRYLTRNNPKHKSGISGVHFEKKHKLWMVSFKINRVLIYLGKFKDKHIAKNIMKEYKSKFPNGPVGLQKDVRYYNAQQDLIKSKV